MEGNVSMQSLSQEAIGQDGVQAPVVMCKAGGSLDYCQTSDKIVRREVLESESWMGPRGFTEWREFEDLKNFMERSDVGNAAPQYTPNKRRQPGFHFTCEA
jgi:hypothetical protein